MLTRTLIHFRPHAYSRSHAHCLHSYQPLSILKRTSLYFQRISQKHVHLMTHSEKQIFVLSILSHNRLLKF